MIRPSHLVHTMGSCIGNLELPWPLPQSAWLGCPKALLTPSYQRGHTFLQTKITGNNAWSHFWWHSNLEKEWSCIFIHAIAHWWCFRQHGRLSGRCGACEVNGFLLWCSNLIRVISAIVPKLCGPSRSQSTGHTFCDLKVGSGCPRSLGNWAPAHADYLHWWILSVFSLGSWHETTWRLAWAASVAVHFDILSLQDQGSLNFWGHWALPVPSPLFPVDIQAGA